MRFLLASSMLALAAFFVVSTNGTSGADKDKKDEPKFSIKDVMKKAHAGKNALRAKVLKGEATDEEKAQLTAMYVALNQATPPAGEADAWKARTKAILDAYK